MKFADKDFNFYWKIIQVPFYLLCAWILASFIISLYSFELYLTVFTGLSNTIISVAIFAFIGYNAVKEHKAKVKEAVWAGVITGFLIGLAGAVISILMVYSVPALTEFSVQRAVQAGSSAPEETIRSMIRIGAYVGLIIGPIINSLIASLVSWIAALIARKV